MDETRGILSGWPAVAGKPLRVAFDGGRLTSDAGTLLLSAIERYLKIAERLAGCIEDPRDPERMRCFPGPWGVSEEAGSGRPWLLAGAAPP